jgi:hypothetical protein
MTKYYLIKSKVLELFKNYVDIRVLTKFDPDDEVSTPGFLSPDAYYAVHRNPRNNVFARHNSK